MLPLQLLRTCDDAAAESPQVRGGWEGREVLPFLAVHNTIRRYGGIALPDIGNAAEGLRGHLTAR